MTTNDILKLIDAGFSAAEIRAIPGALGGAVPLPGAIGGPVPGPESAPAEPDEPAPELVSEPAPAPAPEVKPDRTDEILAALAKLTRAVQASNLRGSNISTPAEKTIDETVSDLFEAFSPGK